MPDAARKIMDQTSQPESVPGRASPSKLPADGLGERSFGVAERVLDSAVLLFAAWTVLTHVVVFVFNGSFGALRWAALGLLPIAFLAWQKSSTRADASAGTPDTAIPRVDRALHFLIAAMLTMTLPLQLDYLVFWFGSLLYLAVAYLRSSAAGELSPHPGGVSRTDALWIWLLALLSALLTAVVHRPDTDDGFFINLSVWALDNPGKALWSEDGLHNIPGLPLLLPSYRTHTLEYLYALLGWLMQLEPITVAHIVLPPLSAAAALISSALLLRALLPRGYALAATALVGFWICMGDTHEGFANHAYVRIFQGKAILVSALLPLLAFAVIRFMASGRLFHWLVVLACVVSAIGLSATGLFIAPLALGAATAASWRPTRQRTLRMLATLATAGYALAIALPIRAMMIDKIGFLNSEMIYGYVKTFPISLVQILGNGPYLYLHLLGPLGAVALAPDLARRRFLAGLGLVYFALVMNPFLYDFWVKYVTSAPVAWRLWWIIPVPVLVAYMMGAPFAPKQGAAYSRRMLALFAFALVSTFAAVPNLWSLSAHNDVTFDWPRLKVPPHAYELAQTMKRLTPRGYAVLAPREVVMWVTTMRGYPRVVVHKDQYLKTAGLYVSANEIGLRVHLFAYVSGVGRSERSHEFLAGALDRLHIGLVGVSRKLPWIGEIDRVMTAAGFARTTQHGFVLWYRSSTKPVALRDVRSSRRRCSRPPPVETSTRTCAR